MKFDGNLMLKKSLSTIDKKTSDEKTRINYRDVLQNYNTLSQSGNLSTETDVATMQATIMKSAVIAAMKKSPENYKNAMSGNISSRVYKVVDNVLCSQKEPSISLGL
jgi:tRNA G46 methylase TrmB